MSESAVLDKLPSLFGLARNRRRPKRLPEPRPSGVHPEEVGVREWCEGTAHLVEKDSEFKN